MFLHVQTKHSLNIYRVPDTHTYLVAEKCYTLPPVFSNSGYHSDGIVYVALEVSESGLSCCWVTDLQGGHTTSLRMIGHSGGVEAVGS